MYDCGSEDKFMCIGISTIGSKSSEKLIRIFEILSCFNYVKKFEIFKQTKSPTVTKISMTSIILVE
jgi:hypothetical protein